MPAIPLYAMSLSIHLPVARSLTFEELDRFKKTYQVPIVSRGSKDGEEVLVAPINAQKAKEFLYEIGILRGKMTSVYRSVGL
ncbi:MAG: hypothetical protein JWM57_877 [Phycisphaerales bacterium]|nr:hypothetical protein [Phycisphaerales bacterium]